MIYTIEREFIEIEGTPTLRGIIIFRYNRDGSTSSFGPNMGNCDCRQFIRDWSNGADVIYSNGAPAVYGPDALAEIGLSPVPDTGPREA